MMLIDDFLRHSADLFADKEALVVDGARRTYADIEAASNQLAHTLISMGIERHDRIAIFLDNSAETIISVFAILKAGGIFLIVNPTTKADKLKFILNDCRAKAIVSSFQKRSVLSKVCQDVPSLDFGVLCGKGEDDAVRRSRPLLFAELGLQNAVLVPAIFESAPTTPVHSNCIDIDLATIIYTSGSTGDPKGVMLTHRNIVNTAASIIQYLENDSSDIIIDVLPLSFDYGLYQVLTAFKIGATVVLEKSFAFPYRTIEIMQQERVTGFPGVPTIFGMLFQLKDLDKRNFDHIRYITNTAAALPPKYITRLKELFPTAKVYSMYGLTECTRALYMPPGELDKRPTSVGKAIPNEEAFVLREDGQKAAPGEIGELVVRGANVMPGYWERPEENARILRPGLHPGEKWLYSGDFFKMDEEGYLYFIARKDDIIKSRGEKVSPKEVENVIYDLDEVLETSVSGIPDDILGQAIKAKVVLRDGAQITERDIIRHCMQHLENFMVPKVVEFCDSLPKTATGKIKKERPAAAS